MRSWLVPALASLLSCFATAAAQAAVIVIVGATVIDLGGYVPTPPTVFFF